MTAAPKKKADEAVAESDTADEAASPSPKPDKALVEQLADPERGAYDAEMVGDSTLIIRYADGTADSYTVDAVQR